MSKFIEFEAADVSVEEQHEQEEEEQQQQQESSNFIDDNSLYEQDALSIERLKMNNLQ